MIKEILFKEVPKEYLLKINKSMDQWQWFGYIANDIIVAVAAIQKHCGNFYMRNVYCCMFYRNTGYASSIVRYIQNSLNATIMLDCQFNLVPFYKKLNFVPIRVRFANGKKYQRMVFYANMIN